VSDSFKINFDGNIICAPRVNSKGNWEIAKADLQNSTFQSFPEVHSMYIETVLLMEEANIIMSGSGDGLAVIYNFETRKIKFKINMGIGEIASGIAVRNIAILGGNQKVGYLNLETGNEIEIVSDDAGVDCSYVLALCIGEREVKRGEKGRKYSQNVLVLGGQNSTSLDFILMDQKFKFLTKYLDSSKSRFFDKSGFYVN
jgi:WD40 repeat protein